MLFPLPMPKATKTVIYTQIYVPIFTKKPKNAFTVRKAKKYNYYVKFFFPKGEIAMLKGKKAIVVGATPDGRHAGYPLSSGSSPVQGRETNCPTAAMLSTPVMGSPQLPRRHSG